MQAPFETEDLLASLSEALKVLGDARAIAVILDGECRIEWETSDFGVDYWSLRVALGVRFFQSLTSEEVKQIERGLLQTAQPFFEATGSDRLSLISISPKVSPAPSDWRTEASRYVKGEGITNQGRVRSDNVASKEHEGLLFRSKTEIRLYEALKRGGLAVAPLPVFVRVGRHYNRLEPDFVVISKGLTFVVEVDGDTFHRETPADADRRLLPLTHEGVEVRRINAADLNTDAEADVVVRQLVEFMTRRKQAR